MAGGIIITIIFGSVYVTLQQIGRRLANAAPAAAAATQVEQMGSETLTGPRLELTADSGVFVIVFGADNQPMSTTVTLHVNVAGQSLTPFEDSDRMSPLFLAA